MTRMAFETIGPEDLKQMIERDVRKSISIAKGAVLIICVVTGTAQSPTIKKFFKVCPLVVILVVYIGKLKPG